VFALWCWPGMDCMKRAAAQPVLVTFPVSFPLTDVDTSTPGLSSRYNRHLKHAGENRARLLTSGRLLANIPSVMSAELFCCSSRPEATAAQIAGGA